MAKRKLSYSQYLTSTPKKRGIYFWVRRGISLLIAIGIGGWLKAYIGDIGSLIAGITVFCLIYIFISHYLALIVMAIEDMMS
ncbi:hypothetical protein [Acinetobacter modestus]|uniref:hypothetical protein n=1 Tax=Acinetobacter modestus TaxID=1776740 RepID=UPI001F4A37E9|nr:hypothetical protein [Acinetobacter modestus]MCH7333993.1 hypothetical protein [Acinetobacter modestus]